MASFDENGKYIKTNWKAGDKITATKLNKIEESIEAVNDNDISRHVEADARLDALEAKDAAHDKEFTNVKNLIEDAKDAAELGDYEINSRMQFLEQELNEGIEEVHNVASTVDGKIATAQANMTTQVNQGKADMEAMVADVEGELDGINSQLEQIIYKSYIYIDDFLLDDNDFNKAFDLAKKEALDKRVPIVLGKKVYTFDKPLLIENGLEIIGCDNENSVLQFTGNGIAITQTSEDTINGNTYSNVTNSTFKRFRLKGQQKEGTVGIHLVNGTNITWDTIVVEGFDKNIILGFKNQQKYILFSRFNFDSIHFRTTGLELLDVQDCHFDRIMVGGHADLYGEIGIRYGNNTDYGEVCEGLNCVFTSPVVQYVKTGFYFDGGLGFTVNGGHSEGVDKLVHQTMYADYGTYFNNFMLSGTVKEFGKMNANGIRFNDSISSDNYLDKRLVCNDSIELNVGDNDFHRYGFIINNSKSRFRKLRFLCSFSTTDGKSADISVRAIQMKTWGAVADFKLQGTSAVLASNWFSINNYMSFNDEDIRFYLAFNTDENINLKINYIDLQCY